MEWILCQTQNENTETDRSVIRKVRSRLISTSQGMISGETTEDLVLYGKSTSYIPYR